MNIWAITSYYNPSGYKSRLRNFKVFHANFGLPLVVVELVLSGAESELAPYLHSFDPEHVIHVVIRQGDVMWQKERLLNVALSKVPREAEGIVWTDCDVVFKDSTWVDEPTWIEELSKTLRSFPVVQCFSQAHQLSADAVRESGVCNLLGTTDLWAPKRPSCVRLYLQTGTVTSGWPGYIWAGQADLLRRHGFYDAQIIGSGDAFFVQAAMGSPFDEHEGVNICRHNSAQVRHFEAWAKPFHEDLKSRGFVGYLDQIVYHLWHGAAVNRQYIKRHHILAAHNFDPKTDIRINEEGSWSWNSDKPALHQAVRDYFVSRNEDG